jgi:NAD(P)-dependent dehydrogenase (short-subunit alcohol dehydrogenase family)
VSLDGKVAVVTGAARGIGKAIALELARLGADVVVAGRSTEERDAAPGTIQATASEVEALGRRALPVPCDIGTQGGIDTLVSAASDAFGHVDVLVNNAAVTGRAIYLSLWDLSREQFEKAIAVNVTAPFMLTQAFTAGMRDRGQGGVVVNLTSGQALPTDSTTPPSGPNDPTNTYGPTKAMIDRLTNTMARELRPHGIRCYALDPGATMTELMARSMASGGRAFDAHPVRWPARVAGWLAASPDAWEHTGRVVRTSRRFLDEHDLPLD